MTSGAEDSGIAWLKALFADEGTLRQVFVQQPELAKELLRNKGFLDTLFDPKSGAFAALLDGSGPGNRGPGHADRAGGSRRRWHKRNPAPDDGGGQAGSLARRGR